MKPILLVLTCVMIFVSSKAQNPISIQNDIKNLGTISSSGTTDRVTGAFSPDAANSQTSAGISTFTRAGVKGSRYLYDDWTKGNVTGFDNTSYSANYTFNYDKLTGNLYAKYDGQGNISVVLDKSKVKSCTIGSMKFVNSTILDPKTSNTFYQVLVEDSANISLYKLTTTTFVKADPTDMMALKTGEITSKYVDEIKYYIRAGNELKKINFNENSLRKALKLKSDKTDAYLNMNQAKDIDEDFLKGLVTYINQ